MEGESGRTSVSELKKLWEAKQKAIKDQQQGQKSSNASQSKAEEPKQDRILRRSNTLVSNFTKSKTVTVQQTWKPQNQSLTQKQGQIKERQEASSSNQLQEQKTSPFEQPQEFSQQHQTEPQSFQNENRKSFDNYLQKSSSIIKNYSQGIPIKKEENDQKENIKQQIQINWNTAQEEDTSSLNQVQTKKESNEENQTSVQTQENNEEVQSIQSKQQQQTPQQNQEKKQIQKEILKQVQQVNQENFNSYIQKSNNILKNYSQKRITQQQESSSSEDEVKQEIKISWNTQKEVSSQQKSSNIQITQNPQTQTDSNQELQQNFKAEQSKGLTQPSRSNINQIKQMFENKIQTQKKQDQQLEKPQQKSQKWQPKQSNTKAEWPPKQSQNTTQETTQTVTSEKSLSQERRVEASETKDSYEQSEPKQSAWKTTFARNNSVSDLISRFEKEKKQQ